MLLLLLASRVSAQPLGAVLDYKYPSVQGITVVDDQITEWPTALGSLPTQAQIDTWRTEYLAAKVETDKQARIDKTNDAMARWVEQLTVVLWQKGTLVTGDIPLVVRNAINARRAERGQAAINW